MKKTVQLAGAFLCVFALSCCVGKFSLSLQDIVLVLCGQAPSDLHHTVFWEIRVSRTVLVALCGGALALAGYVYQELFANPLVSPDVLGVSSGASVGAICAILWGTSALSVQLWSFVGGIAVVVLSLLLSHFMGGNRLFTMILSGIILGSFANSIIMTLKYTADPLRQLATIEYWLMGSFHTTVWADVQSTLPIFLVAGAVLLLLRRVLVPLSLGEEQAQSLGIAVKPMRTLLILCATLLVSGAVSVAGVVSWIGLIVPHMVRLFAPREQPYHMVQTLLAGSILLLLADMFARAIFTAEVPIGIVTSLMGGAFLLLFLHLRNRKMAVEVSP